MRVFRIGAAVFTRSWKEAFSGNSGMYASARWHTAGHPIIYTAQSLSLAALEILVRLKQTNDIQPFFVYSAEVPGLPDPQTRFLSGAMEEPGRG